MPVYTCMNKPFRRCIHPVVLATLLIAAGIDAKTRWSAFQGIPHADFIKGGAYSLQSANFATADSLGNSIETRVAYELRATVGATRWINLEAGYSDGLVFGFKARLLGETRPYTPSLCVGVRNIGNHREANFFNSPRLDSSAEFFAALGKDVEPIRTRFHGGILSIPSIEGEKINPFFGIESYAGVGIYYSIEVYRRDSSFIPSLYAIYRMLDDRVEISAGIIGIKRLLINSKNEFSFAFSSPPGPSEYIRPGIFFGLRYRGDIAFGQKEAFNSVEDLSISLQQRLENFNAHLARIEEKIEQNSTSIKGIKEDIIRLDNALSDHKTKLRTILMDKLLHLKTLYHASPYKPQQVQQTIQELTNYKFNDKAMKIFQEFALDKTQDREIRILAIEILGEIGKNSAADILLDICANEEDPGIRIACIISIGKMEATEAIPLLRRLSNAPDDNIAISAQEVLGTLTDGASFAGSPSRYNKALRTIAEADTAPETNVTSSDQSAAATNPDTIQTRGGTDSIPNDIRADSSVTSDPTPSPKTSTAATDTVIQNTDTTVSDSSESENAPEADPALSSSDTLTRNSPDAEPKDSTVEDQAPTDTTDLPGTEPSPLSSDTATSADAQTETDTTAAENQ